ncbi:MAG: CpaF family protein [Pseudomonadota bacterium]
MFGKKNAGNDTAAPGRSRGPRSLPAEPRPVEASDDALSAAEDNPIRKALSAAEVAFENKVPLRDGETSASSLFSALEEETLTSDEDIAPEDLTPPPQAAADEEIATYDYDASENGSDAVIAVKEQVLPRLLDRIDAEAAAALSKTELHEEFRPIVMEVLAELKINLNRKEQAQLEALLIDELLGLGPLEVLLSDTAVNDIMVNGPKQVYVERKGKLVLTNIRFRDEDHLLHVAQRICNKVGRRIDQTTPLADARLEDGSRVNVIIPPLSLKGTSISIRKFSNKPITIDMMASGGSMNRNMCDFLKIAGACRLNVVISGGTGSGKTTMLNAMSKLIDQGERVVTIEDAAELNLQQPHVVTLETRPANLEGQGAVSIRDLLINSLRMRPDRIILGEIRGGECLDMLQAMNTGHDGSMATLHANKPREAITRMENMVNMSGVNYPLKAIRQQISEAVDLIVQVKRLRDGSRRTTSITEVVGMEGEVMVTQELFKFVYEGEDDDGKIIGDWQSSGVRPSCYEKVRQFGLDKKLMECIS